MLLADVYPNNDDSCGSPHFVGAHRKTGKLG